MIAIDKLEDLAREAGAEIRRIYESHSYSVSTKADRSPVTEADLAANAILVTGLKQFGALPYISEEEPRQTLEHSPERYWLIDPLDGTKEFVNRRKSFTVNIALIEMGVPTVAVVYDPMEERMYSAFHGDYRENGRIISAHTPWPAGTILLSSHSHPEEALTSFLSRNSITEHHRVGSSIKFCLVASRRAHIYPRFHSLNAWDTAAGDGVARAAGCHVIDWQTGLPPIYAYEQALTPAFCISAPQTAIQR
ncbi:MAG: 3'(2'),5'-bisphosphate nucleotidase CysQ [Proteobacteria bacterium]|nr:MAG: 3'(2'),5'-bisphosphate nucleotidase CysQ [Pseudomonadota bacterium]